MARVFPWTSESALLLAAVLLGVLAYLVLASLLHQRVRKLLVAQREEAGLETEILSPATWRRLESALGWVLVGGGVLLLAYAGTWIWEPVDALVLAPLLRVAPAVALLGGLLLVAVSALDFLRQGARYFRGELSRRPPRVLNPQLVSLLHLFLRYVVVASAGLGGLFVLLGALGIEQDLGATILAWFRAQAASLLFLASLVAIGWVGGRIIRAVAADVGASTRRVTPQFVDVVARVARGGLYAFVGILAVFTVLSAVGLGSVAGTMIVVLSTFLGLVVAMAGTGSIGNALAGGVLSATKPFQKGDRVVILDGLVCDVEATHLLFTRVRSLAGESVDVPNNLVLQNRIRNLSRSGPHAIVVRLGIGYDAHHETVRRLALEAARATPGIEGEPAPQLYAVAAANYAIDYDLYAYTRDPRHLPIRSALLGKLQEVFYGAGIEIMTPDVYVLRPGRRHEAEDGTVTLVPDGPGAPGRAPASGSR